MSCGKRWRRVAWVLLLPLAIVLALLLRPTIHLLRAAAADVDELEPTPPGFTDDASRLNQTAVAEVWPVPTEPALREQQLAALLARAARDGLKIAIAGARHSMGGHTIYPGGIIVDMRPWREMTLQSTGNVLTVGSGALWQDIIPYLDRHGRSVAVMQSNDSFSVGGSISVNCHGWQYDQPPIAATVIAFRLMLADGSVRRCSREQNAELFSLALGGYGLLGIILEVDLRVVANERYRLAQRVAPLAAGLEAFDRERKDPGLQMLYGRLDINPEHLFEDVIINTLYREDGMLPPLQPRGMTTLRRTVFRGSAANDYGKRLRWRAETVFEPMVRGNLFSRNQLMSEGVEVFQNRNRATTDILHEYFVPRGEALAFVRRLQVLIPQHWANLLNVTVRAVNEDTDTMLRYADQPLLSFVMLFVQPRSAAGEEQMQALTRDLIDASLAHHGRYYLPYRLHASNEQFRRAYPQAAEFFSRKRHWDPGELFQNEFYLRYGASPAAAH